MRVGLRRPAAVVAALLAVSSSACSAPHTDTPTPAVTAKLAASVPDKLAVGVVVSQTSPLGEGAEWRNAAEGARVAANRFALGGASVTLVPVNDRGTADGAVAAVKTLADQGVAGIVLATSGDHIAGAVQQAAARHVPVVLPYATSADGLPADVWITGPTADVADGRLVEDAGGPKPDQAAADRCRRRQRRGAQPRSRRRSSVRATTRSRSPPGSLPGRRTRRRRSTPSSSRGRRSCRVPSSLPCREPGSVRRSCSHRMR